MVNKTKNKDIPSMPNETTNWLTDKKKSLGNNSDNFKLKCECAIFKEN